MTENQNEPGPGTDEAETLPPPEPTEPGARPAGSENQAAAAGPVDAVPVVQSRSWAARWSALHGSLGHPSWSGIGAVTGILGLIVTVIGVRVSMNSPAPVPVEIKKAALTPVTKPDVALTMRYSLPFADALPYGLMYSPAYPDGVNAAPRTMEQMHTDLRAVMGKDNRTGTVVETAHGAIRNAPVASYLIILNNKGTAAGDYRQIDLTVSSCQVEPPRSIWVWHQKGVLKPEVTEVSLQARPGSMKIYPVDDGIIHLASNETLPIRMNVNRADPGVYRFYVTASGLPEQPGTTLSSKEDILAMPADEVTTRESFHLYADLEGAELARRINGLTDVQFHLLTSVFLGRIPKSQEVDDFLRRTFHVSSPPRAPDDVVEKMLRSSIAGMKDIYNREGAKAALPYFRDYLSRCPGADEVRYMEILALRDLGDRDLAELRARELENDIPDSAYGYYGTWLLNEKVENLDAALGRDPERGIFLAHGIQRYIIEESSSPSVKLSPCFKRLAEQSRWDIAAEVLQSNLTAQYGLELRTPAVERLIKFDPIFARILGAMPQYAVWNLAKPAGKDPPAGEEAIFDTMVNTGRIVLAKEYAAQCSRPDLVEKAMCYARDFTGLYHDFYSTANYIPRDADSYLAAGLVLLHLGKGKLVDDLIAKCKPKYPNQTLLILGNARMRERKFDEGKLLFALYFQGQQSRGVDSSVAFGKIEDVFARPEGTELILRGIREAAPQNERYDPIRDIWDSFYPATDTGLTEWPLSRVSREWGLGRQSTWLMLAMLAKVGITSPTQPFVRLPLGISSLQEDRVNEDYPLFRGLDLETCKRLIPDGDKLFAAGAYGVKLTSEQMQASHLFSIALYEYWNAGDLAAALASVNDALAHDPGFYDALVLRSAVLCSLNRVEESLKVGRAIETAFKVASPSFARN